MQAHIKEANGIKFGYSNMALYGTETWTLRAADQKYLESFEM